MTAPVDNPTNTLPWNHLTVSVPPASKTYPLIVSPDGLEEAGDILAHFYQPGAQRFLIISDRNVAPLYRATLQLSLEQAGFQSHDYVLPAGETTKTLGMLQQIYDQALSLGLSRNDVFIALGGGVIGDITGFAAATYYRGVRLVQMPTTLLAQVDSSVGGKVGVNYDTVKNGIGAFYQPSLVLIDPRVLATLPERELLAGLSEVVKYGLIETSAVGRNQLFSYLVQHAKYLAPVLGGVIEACCAIKAAVVVQDETERSGQRMLLNFGHTFGHAFEAALGYGTLLHGEAVAIGMIKAFQLSVATGRISETLYLEVRQLFEKLGLPTQLSQPVDPRYLLHLMRQDKKADQGRIKLILPVDRLGQVDIVSDVADSDILDVLALENIPAS